MREQEHEAGPRETERRGGSRTSSRPPLAVALRPGTVVGGRYVVVQALGRGGMSQVMLAHDQQLGRNVALKVLLTQLSSEEGRVRMEREARAMAQLSHPNVVNIFDVGTHQGNVYLTMEYIDGETLHQWLKAPHSWREVLAVMKQAGRGLSAAHAAGIVHRDFKPENVVIGRDGRVRVLDFGIARTGGTVSGGSGRSGSSQTAGASAQAAAAGDTQPDGEGKTPTGGGVGVERPSATPMGASEAGGEIGAASALPGRLSPGALPVGPAGAPDPSPILDARRWSVAPAKGAAPSAGTMSTGSLGPSTPPREGAVSAGSLGSLGPPAPSAVSSGSLPSLGSQGSMADWASAGSSSGGKLTEEGVIVGTIGYVPPETAFEQQADERSDVFSFCVTLWVALYGKRPYTSESIDAYLNAVVNDALEAAPSGRHVPGWVHDAVRKGLYNEPSRRPASMHALLEALEADPSRTRVARVGALAVVAMSCLTAAGWVHHRRAVRAGCAAEGRALVSEWQGAHRDAARGLLLAGATAAAAQRAERVLTTLDRYAQDWGDTARTSCEATRLYKTQTPSVGDKRAACLLEDRQEFEAIVDVLGNRDSLAQRRAAEIVQILVTPQWCAGHEAEMAFVPLPEDAAARKKAQDARRLGIQSTVLLRSGQPNKALTLAEQARDLAREAGVPRDQASAMLDISSARNDMGQDSAAEQVAFDAFEVAERAGADRIAGIAASQHAISLSNRAQALGEAREFMTIAAAKLARLGNSEQLERHVLAAQAAVEAQSRHLDAADAAYAKLIEIDGRLYGQHSGRVCKDIYNRVYTLQETMAPDTVVANLRQAIACFSEATSPQDPWLGVVNMVLADALLRAQRPNEARAAAERAVELRAHETPNDGATATARMMLANIDELEGRPADAEVMARKALAAVEGQRGWVTAWMPEFLSTLGLARLDEGDAHEAEELCSRAATLAEHDPETRAGHILRVDWLACFGEAELSLGNVDKARAYLERSVQQTLRREAVDLPKARLALARALWQGPGADRVRAVHVAEQARDELQTLAKTQPWVRPTLEAAKQWLATAAAAQPGMGAVSAR